VNSISDNRVVRYKGRKDEQSLRSYEGLEVCKGELHSIVEDSAPRVDNDNSSKLTVEVHKKDKVACTYSTNITRVKQEIIAHSSIHPSIYIYPCIRVPDPAASGHKNLPILSTPAFTPVPTLGPAPSATPIPNILDKYVSQSCVL